MALMLMEGGGDVNIIGADLAMDGDDEDEDV